MSDRDDVITEIEGVRLRSTVEIIDGAGVVSLDFEEIVLVWADLMNESVDESGSLDRK